MKVLLEFKGYISQIMSKMINRSPQETAYGVQKLANS